jgi:hypothetical protein
LVQGEQRARRPACAHFAQDMLNGNRHAREASGGAGGRTDLEAVREFGRGLGLGRFSGR